MNHSFVGASLEKSNCWPERGKQLSKEVSAWGLGWVFHNPALIHLEWSESLEKTRHRSGMMNILLVVVYSKKNVCIPARFSESGEMCFNWIFDMKCLSFVRATARWSKTDDTILLLLTRKFEKKVQFFYHIHWLTIY